DGFEIDEVRRTDGRVAIVLIPPAQESHLLFTQPSSYQSLSAHDQSAFQRGSVYFRHGAKSEPGTAADLRDFIEHRIELIRGQWLGNIRQVIAAPQGAEVVTIQRLAEPEGSPQRIRITTDENAPI